MSEQTLMGSPVVMKPSPFPTLAVELGSLDDMKTLIVRCVACDGRFRASPNELKNLEICPLCGE